MGASGGLRHAADGGRDLRVERAENTGEGGIRLDGHRNADVLHADAVLFLSGRASVRVHQPKGDASGAAVLIVDSFFNYKN